MCRTSLTANNFSTQNLPKIIARSERVAEQDASRPIKLPSPKYRNFEIGPTILPRILPLFSTTQQKSNRNSGL